MRTALRVAVAVGPYTLQVSSSISRQESETPNMKLRAALCCLAASGLLLSACSDDSGTIDDPSAEPAASESTEEAQAEAFDPPKEFDDTAGVALPEETVLSKMNTTGVNVQELPAALVGTKAFITSAERLQVVDTVTGEALPDVVPQSGTPMDPMVATGLVGENPYEAPIAVDSGGTALVVVPFIVSGDDGHYDLDVVAVDAASGEVAFSVPIELPVLTFSGYAHAEAMGESGGVVVIGVGDQYTVAVDLAAKALAWENPMVPEVVTGDVVIGMSPDAETYAYDALLIADGSPKWQGKDLGLADIASTYQLSAAGPNYFVVLGSNYSLENGQLPYDMLFDAATGDVVRQDDRDLSGYECRFDGLETVICFYRSPEFWVGAMDAATGEWLWETTETAPGVNVTAVWHGIVYGIGTSGPAALDARTGADTGTAPGVAPYVVNEYTAIADTVTGQWGAGGVSAYPAIG
jgi:hypothetical protein